MAAHLLQVFVIFKLIYSLHSVNNKKPMMTTDSNMIGNATERLCGTVSSEKFNSGEKLYNKIDHMRNLDADNNVVINLSNCKIKDLNLFICSMCSKSRNMSINMSLNKIKTLDGIGCSCHGVIEINLSKNEITVLVANSLNFAKYATKIDISANIIYRLNKHVFDELKLLQSLDLSRNALSVLKANIFNDLESLGKLNLSENEIQIIESGTFLNLKSLEVLDISCNNIHSLDSEAFKGLGNLKYLNISHNQLTDPILSYLSIFLNLISVNLGYNNFEKFVEGSLNMFHIHEFILNNLPDLRYILNGAFRNGDFLQRMDISRNRKLIFIEEFAFQNISDNITFDISFTNLTSFPLVSNDMKVKFEETPINCTFIPVDATFNQNCSSEDKLTNNGPLIVSQTEEYYSTFIGQRLLLHCFAVGQPTPLVKWERVHTGFNGSKRAEVIAGSYFLNLDILFLNMEGEYRCVAESNGKKVYQYFHIKVRPIDVKVKVLSRSSNSILITWDKTYLKEKYVLIYRAFETSSYYVFQKLNTFSKLYVIRSLHPFTDYEICIASFSDINDKSCVRVMTLMEENKTEGIRYNHLAIAFLAISGVIFGIFILTILYRCADKIRMIARQKNVFIVGSESRECFADVTESTFTYENQHIEHFSEQ